MNMIDIRGDVKVQTSVRFADANDGDDHATLVERDFDSDTVLITNDDGTESVTIALAEDALNLVKALNYAVSEGWFNE